MIDHPDLEPDDDETKPDELPPHARWEWVPSGRREISQVLSDTGEEVAAIGLPYDHDNPPTEEELLADASRFWADLELTNSFLALAGGILALERAEGIEDTREPRSDDEIGYAAQLEGIGALVLAARNELGVPIFPDEEGQKLARDMIARVLADIDDAAAERAGSDARESDLRQEVRRLREAALMNLVAHLRTGSSPWQAAAGPGPAETGPTAPAHDPVRAFDDAGYGHANNTLVATTARRGFLADKQTRWETESWPQFRHETAAGQALLTPSPAHFPTAQDAMQAVERYGQRHAAILRYLTAKHVAAAGMGNTGPYGGFYVGAKEIAENLGLEKHSEGGYRPDDLRDIVAVVQDLEQARVLGEVEGRLPGMRTPRRLTIEANLIVLSQYVREPSMFDGDRRVVGWYLRAGDWAAELERFGPQHALTTRALLQLHPNKYGQSFALGCHIEELFRIRAREGNYRQPLTVSSLLAGAEIPLPTRNLDRFRPRFENWLDVLANPYHMRGTPLLKDWKYRDEFEPHVKTSGRGWGDRWLAAGVILYPADEIVAAYAGITAKGKNAKGGRPRKLELGKPKAT